MNPAIIAEQAPKSSRLTILLRADSAAASSAPSATIKNPNPKTPSSASISRYREWPSRRNAGLASLPRPPELEGTGADPLRGLTGEGVEGGIPDRVTSAPEAGETRRLIGGDHRRVFVSELVRCFLEWRPRHRQGGEDGHGHRAGH